MVAIESTPDMAAKLYATMRQDLAVVRRRLQKPLTLGDKWCSAISMPLKQDLDAGPPRSRIAVTGLSSSNC